MSDRCVAGDRLRTVMSSIMRRRRGLKSAISILLSEGVGSNTHILSAKRRSTPPRHARRDSGFVQSQIDSDRTDHAQMREIQWQTARRTAQRRNLLGDADRDRKLAAPLQYGASALNHWDDASTQSIFWSTTKRMAQTTRLN